MEILLFILAYVVVFFINRWLYFRLQKMDENLYPNPIAVFACFLFLMGTVIFLMLFLVFSDKECKFFKIKDNDKE